MRIALGVSYTGTAYQGWQSQPGGVTVQDHLEKALGRFMDIRERVVLHCAGRTDAGVHAINQVVHFDTQLKRDDASWVRGTNRYLPPDIAVQWSEHMPKEFHARNAATGRRYIYIVLESAVRPSLNYRRVGWSWRQLDMEAMRQAASIFLGEHDFSAFRSSQCQSPTPIKTLRKLNIQRNGQYWLFEFEANAFLHHMVRNLMGMLLAIGSGDEPPQWAAEVLVSKKRACAAPTFSADGLYFIGPQYETHWQIPQNLAELGGIPGYIADDSGICHT